MVLSSKISTYMQNSLLRGKLCCWKKAVVMVFISPITSLEQTNKVFLHSEVERAIMSWNGILRSCGINLQFQVVSQATQADIVVHWVKVGRVYEGMCKYLSIINDEIKKVSIEIGLPNSYSGKTITDLSIYCAIMHEFGHSLGLGHGVEIDDIMFVPHQKNISTPSENDLYVLKKMYLG